MKIDSGNAAHLTHSDVACLVPMTPSMSTSDSPQSGPHSARIAFVCSTDTHVHTFHPVACALEEAGNVCIFASLDRFYAQGAEQAAASLGRQAARLAESDPALPGGRFYDRPVPAVWRDVLRSRRHLARWLDELSPAALVLGNDSGLIEKSVIDLARRRSIPTILVQDGRLVMCEPLAKTWSRRLQGYAKRIVSPLLEHMGRAYLASSRYGEGGTDLVLATGPAGARILQARSSRHTRVLVVGQPRYDRLTPLLDSHPNPARLAMFTTDFAQARVGEDVQAAQERFAQEVAESVRTVGVEFLLKPHPRESAERYRALLGDSAVTTQDPAIVIGSSGVALIGISTLVEEAAILRTPVLVPGQVIHDRSFEPALPNRDAYPRVESGRDVVDWLERLARPGILKELLDRQVAIVSDAVSFNPTQPAAARVAQVIMETLTKWTPA